MKMKIEKCAILGANGYIGSHLSAFLSKQGYEVANYDIQEKSNLKNYKKIDISDLDSINCLDLDVKYLFVFSGLTGTFVGFAKYKSFIDVNETGLLNLLDYIQKSSYRPHIIFPSTRLIYKGSKYPLKEDDEKETKTIYAVNKLACEGFLYAYNSMYNIPYSVFRICVPYGNFLTNNYSFGTIGFFLNKALKGEDIVLYGDGSLKRTFTHVTDLCNQIIECVKNSSSVNGIYNIGGETYSLKDTATLIANKYGVGIKFVPWPKEDLKMESGDTFFDDSKINRVIGQRKYISFSEFNWINQSISDEK